MSEYKYPYLEAMPEFWGLWVCVHCNRENPSEEKVCRYCGAEKIINPFPENEGT